MTYIKSILSCTLLAAALQSAALSLEVQPGELASLATEEATSATSLTLTGSIDKRDFDSLRDLFPALRELDLSGVSIAAYKPYKITGMVYAEYPAATLPPGALLGKELTALTLPADIAALGESSLAGNALTELSLPASLTTIGDYALYGNAALTSITLPATLTSIGTGALGECTALTSVEIAFTAPLPADCFVRCTALEQVLLPAGATQIGARAFAGCSALQSIELPASLKTIGDNAFAATGLQSIALPGSLTGVGDFAFALCPALEQATFAGSPTLGQGLFFHDEALAEVSFVSDEQTPLSYPDYLFTGASALSHPFGLEGVHAVGRYALKDNTATTLSLGSDLAYMGDGAMEGITGLEMIDAQGLGTAVPELGTDVFAGINQQEVRLITAEGEDTAPWESADQWKEFAISAFSTVSAPGAEAAQVKAWFAGTNLLVRSSQVIEKVQVANPAGAVLVALSPADTQAFIDMQGLSERIYIVVVTTPQGSTTFKLTR